MTRVAVPDLAPKVKRQFQEAAMEFYTSPTSPYCRKVEVVLQETGLGDLVTRIDASGTPMAPNETTIGANPVGKIPVLIREDGPALYDSRVICRYLDASAGAKLYPESRVWDILTLEATADGVMDAALLMVYEGRLRAETERSADWVEAQWIKVDRTLSALESRWMSHLSGPLNMGQIAVGCALGYLDFRHADRDWQKSHVALAGWWAEFSARDSMAGTAPQG